MADENEQKIPESSVSLSDFLVEDQFLIPESSINIDDFNFDSPEEVVEEEGVGSFLKRNLWDKTGDELLGDVVEGVAGFYGNVAEGVINEVYGTVAPETVAREGGVDLVETSGTVDSIAQGVGQAVGQMGVIFGTTAAAATAATAAAASAPVVAAAAGATFAATAGLSYVQGVRQELFGTEESLKQEMLAEQGREPTQEEYDLALDLALKPILLGEGVDVGLALTAGVGKGIAIGGKTIAKAAGLGVPVSVLERESVKQVMGRLGRIGKTVASAGAEGVGEVIQGAGSRAAVGSVARGTEFGEEFIQEATSPEAKEEFIVGAAVGGIVGGVASARQQAREEGADLGPDIHPAEDPLGLPEPISSDLFVGSEISARVADGTATEQDMRAVSVNNILVNLRSETNDKDFAIVPPDVASPGELQDILRTDREFEVEPLGDGSTKVKVNPEADNAIESLGKRKDESIAVEAELEDTINQLGRLEQQRADRRQAVNEVREESVQEDSDVESEKAVVTPEPEEAMPTEMRRLVDRRDQLIKNLDSYEQSLYNTGGLKSSIPKSELPPREAAATLRNTDPTQSDTRRVNNNKEESLPPDSVLPAVPESPTAPDLTATGKEENGIVALGIGNNFRNRTFSERVKNDPTISRHIRDKVVVGEYQQVTEEDTIGQVKKKIREGGVFASAEQILSGDMEGLTERQKIAFGTEVVRELDSIIQTTDATGDYATTDMVADTAAAVADKVAGMGTESGRAVQMFARFARESTSRFMKNLEDRLSLEGRKLKLTPEQKARLRKMHEASKAAPPGLIQRRLQSELLTEIGKLQGIAPSDLMSSIWYANILSGPSTHGINIFGSVMNIFGKSFGMMHSPKDMYNFYVGMFHSVPTSFRDSLAIMQEEEFAKINTKLQNPDTLRLAREIAKDRAEGGTNLLDRSRNKASQYFYTAGNFVSKSLLAGDGLFYRTASEGMSRVVAARKLRDNPELDTSEKFAAALNEELGFSKDQREAATARANTELKFAFGTDFSPRDVERRSFEILEDSRDDLIRDKAHRFGLRSTFTERPEGALGVIADGVNGVLDRLTVDIPFTSVKGLRYAKFLVPFVNVPGNVANAFLDFTPVGLARGSTAVKVDPKKLGTKEFITVEEGKFLGVGGRHAFDSHEAKERITTGILGTGAATMLYLKAAEYADDEDPEFWIYAQGPENKAKRSQLMSRGWKPYTIKIGDSYLKYNETPLGIGLAVVGAYLDAIRYKEDFVDQSYMEHAGKVFSSFVGSFGDMSFLKTTGDIFDFLGSKSPLKSLESIASNVAGGAIPMAGFFREINKILDPKLKDTEQGFAVKLTKNIPFISNLEGFNKPALNAFGDPIEYDMFSRTPVLSRFISVQKKDPLWEFMAEKGLWISGISRKQSLVFPKKGVSQRRVESIKSLRESKYGRIAAEYFTPEEKYEFAEKSGKRTKDFITKLKNHPKYARMDNKELQKELNKEVRKIRKQIKLDILGL